MDNNLMSDFCFKPPPIIMVRLNKGLRLLINILRNRKRIIEINAIISTC